MSTLNVGEAIVIVGYTWLLVSGAWPAPPWYAWAVLILPIITWGYHHEASEDKKIRREKEHVELNILKGRLDLIIERTLAARETRLGRKP